MTAMARLTTLLFAMWLGVTVSTVVDLEKRIIGGQECGPHERLYHVRLITSAGSRTFTAYIGMHPGPPKEVPIKDPPVIFNDGEQHDLMLLKLPEAVVGIKPVPLPDCQNPPKIGELVQIAGHGNTKAGPNNERQYGSSKTLQCADMEVSVCRAFNTYKHEHWICTSTPSMDATHGDSGGGVVYQDKIYGVIVHGHKTIVAHYPLMSMDLCYGPYNQWIRKTIAQP